MTFTAGAPAYWARRFGPDIVAAVEERNAHDRNEAQQKRSPGR